MLRLQPTTSAGNRKYQLPGRSDGRTLSVSVDWRLFSAVRTVLTESIKTSLVTLYHTRVSIVWFAHFVHHSETKHIRTKTVNLMFLFQPKNCQYCHIRAAFKGSRCASCAKSEKKYGSPVVCEQCKVKCAFAKNEESRSKASHEFSSPNTLI